MCDYVLNPRGFAHKIGQLFFRLNDFFMHERCWYMCPHVTPKFFWKKSIRCVICGAICVFRLGTDPFLVTFESLVAHSLAIFIVKLVCCTVQTCLTLLSIPSKLLTWLVLDSTWLVIASLLLLSDPLCVFVCVCVCFFFFYWQKWFFSGISCRFSHSWGSKAP